MGNAKFFYYPQPDGRHLVEIDMGEALGELQSTIQHDAVDAITQSGGIFRSVSRGAEFVNIQRDRMQLGEDLAIQFEALQNHLDRGFSCMAVSDHAKAWAASAIPSPNGGDNVISVGNAVFTDITGTVVDGASLVPVAGDYLVIETDSPPLVREVVEVQSASLDMTTGGTITLVNPVSFDYTGRKVFVRYYRFFPVVKRPQEDIGTPLITNEGGRLFSLSVRLVFDYEFYFALYNGNGESVPLTQASPTTGDLNNNEGTFTLDTARNFIDTRPQAKDININTSVMNAIRRGPIR